MSEYGLTKERKVIQVVVHREYLLALCDDGTLWRKFSTVSGEWERISVPPKSGM